MTAGEMRERDEGSEPIPKATVGARPVWLWVGLALVFGLSSWMAVQLWRGVPTVQTLEGWMWPIRDLHVLGFGLLGACLFVFPYLIRAAVSCADSRSTWRVLCGLVALAFCFEQGLAFAENRGDRALREHLTKSGHAEFAVTASRDLNVYQTMRDYEAFVRAGDQAYARSKPPGQLLFYIVVARVADLVMPLIADPPLGKHSSLVNRRHLRLVNFALVLFPLLGALTIVPLTLLSRYLLPSERVLWPALIYLTSAAPSLIQMHLDQALYPLLTASFWFACAASVASRSRWRWAILGALAWIALFVSFSLLPMLLIGGVLVLALGNRLHVPWPRLAEGVAVASFTVLALSVLARLVIHYDPFVAYARAMKNHLAWKGWTPERRWTWAKLDLIEFGYWLGVPLASAFLVAACSLVRPPRLEPVKWVAAATVLAVFLTAAFGETIAESARLWIFFIPAVAVAAAFALTRIPRRFAAAELVLPCIVAAQLIWTFSLKSMQDFWWLAARVRSCSPKRRGVFSCRSPNGSATSRRGHVKGGAARSPRATRARA